MQRDDAINGGFTSGEYEVLTPNYKDTQLKWEQLRLGEYESIVLYQNNS